MGGSGTSPLEKFNARDLAKSTGDALVGVAKQIPSALPTPDTMASMGKNVLAGYPVKYAFDAINMFCKYLSMADTRCSIRSDFNIWLCRRVSFVGKEFLKNF